MKKTPPRMNRPGERPAKRNDPPEGSTTRLSEQVYESIVEMIVRGQLIPGQSVSELALARTLDVSRTPVHEAIKQLVKEGLMLQAANRRPVVISFGTEDVHDVYEMRCILESEAAAKAAQRIDRPTLDRLQASLQAYQRTRGAAKQIAQWVKLDDEFHSAVATAAGSPRLAADIARYRQLHRIFNRSHTDPAVLGQAAEEHQRILAALTARDAEEARQAMRQHLQEWQR